MQKIAPGIIGMNVFDQAALDTFLIGLDGTGDKSNLGANAMLGVSMATARAAATAIDFHLYSYLGGAKCKAYAGSDDEYYERWQTCRQQFIDIQEFMIMPVGAKNFKEGLRMCAEIYHSLKKLLKKEEFIHRRWDEGGFAPNLPDAQAALAYIVRATEEAGYKAGEEVSLALDVAATELYDRSFKKYVFEGEVRQRLQSHSVIRKTDRLL